MIEYSRNLFFRDGPFADLGITRFGFLVMVKAIGQKDVSSFPSHERDLIERATPLLRVGSGPAPKSGHISYDLLGQFRSDNISYPENDFLPILVEGHTRHEGQLRSLFDTANRILLNRMAQWAKIEKEALRNLPLAPICPGCGSQDCNSIFSNKGWEDGNEGVNLIGGAACIYPKPFREAFDNYISHIAREEQRKILERVA